MTRSKILSNIFSQITDFERFEKVHLNQIHTTYILPGRTMIYHSLTKTQPNTGTVNGSFTYLRC